MAYARMEVCVCRLAVGAFPRGIEYRVPGLKTLLTLTKTHSFLEPQRESLRIEQVQEIQLESLTKQTPYNLLHTSGPRPHFASEM